MGGEYAGGETPPLREMGGNVASMPPLCKGRWYFRKKIAEGLSPRVGRFRLGAGRADEVREAKRLPYKKIYPPPRSVWGSCSNVNDLGLALPNLTTFPP